MTDIIFNGGTTLDNQTIQVSAGDRLIFGPATDAVISGSNTIAGGGTFISEGSLMGESAGGANASVLEIDTGFINYGTITGIGELIIDGSFTNYGTIISGAVLLDYDTDTASLLASVSRIGEAAVTYDGTLDNAGQTLDISNRDLSSSLIMDGTIVGGTVTGASNLYGWALLLDGTLDGVTVLGSLVLQGSVAVENGLTAASPYSTSVELDGDGTLFFAGAQTLNMPGGVTFTDIHDTGRSSALGGSDLLIGAQTDLQVLVKGMIVGGTVENSGNILVGDYFPTQSQPGILEITTGEFLNTNEIGVEGGVLVLSGGTFANTGTIYVGKNVNGLASTIDVRNGSADLGDIRLQDQGGETIKDEMQSATSATPLTGTLSDFGGSDRIIFPNLLYSSADTATYDNGVLTIADDGTTIASLTVEGSYAPGFFQIGEYLPGGFGIEIVACYCRGTMILTPAGEVPVEDLRIGDCVTTHAGEARPVRWIGRRSYDGRFVAGRRDVLPIRFSPGSLGPDIPHRELRVSPHHAMFLGGALVPAELLVNGVSVVQEDAVEQVEYFHVELDTHDVLIADGAPAESFVDRDSRQMFQNAAEFAALHPERLTTVLPSCARRLEAGFELLRIRAAIDARAGLPAASAGTLLGHLDEVRPDRIAGWAFAPADPARPVTLLVELDGRVIGPVLAARHRADLERAGHGSGRCGFEIAGLGRATRARMLRIIRESDGAELAGSPVLIPAAVPQLRIGGGGREAAEFVLREALRLAEAETQLRSPTAGMAR